MGLITTLINAHDEKKRFDFEKQMATQKEMLTLLPHLSPEAQQTVIGNAATLFGDKLDLPKKQHGMLAQILSNTLGKMNPFPKDDTGSGMKPLPQAGPPIKGAQIGGQELPGGAAYPSPYLSDEQMQARDQQQQLQQSKVQSQIERQKDTEKLNTRREALTLAGLDPHSQSAQDYILSGKLPTHFGDPTQAKAKPTRIKVDGKWEDALIRPDGTHTTLSGEDIDPATIENADPKAEPKAPQARQSYHYTELLASAKALYPKATDEQIQQYVGKQIELEEAIKLQHGSLTTAGQRQAQAIAAEDSGIGAPGGSVALPKPPPGAQPSAPSAVTPKASRPSGAAGLPGGPAGPAEGVKPPKGPGGPAAVDSGAPGTPVTPARMAYLEQHDPDIATYMSTLTGLGTGTRGKGMNIRAMRGREKLLALIPGSTVESIAAEKNGRDVIKKAIAGNAYRLEAYAGLSQQIDKLGAQLQRAAAKFPSTSPKWNEIKQYIAKHYTGDPDTAALVTAANEFQRIYGRFSSGGGMSAAQTNVSAQNKTDEIISAVMKGETIAAVLGQVQQGADNDIEGMKTAIKQGQRAIAKPWGSFSVDDIVAPREGPIAGGQGGPPASLAGHGIPDLGSTFNGGRVLKVTPIK